MTLTYDAKGKMNNALASGITTSYAINYQALRVKKANTNEIKLFIHDEAGHILGEYDQSGNALRELFWLGDTPVAISGSMPCLTGANGCTEQATAYVWTDHLNTPRELTRVNASNQHVSIWKWDSLPFGETSPNANPSSLGLMTFNHRFPGQYQDIETGLHQNYFREYSPFTGRYIQSDPIGLTGGTNTFSYVFSSPINGTDKLGLCTIVVVNLNGLGHAGVYVDNGPDGKPFLFDPGGSYMSGKRGSNEAFYGKDANIDDYIKFQQKDGENVKVFRFDTTKTDEKKIGKNAESQDGSLPGMCAASTSNAIRGVGPFKKLGASFLPSGLAKDLNKLAQGCK